LEVHERPARSEKARQKPTDRPLPGTVIPGRGDGAVEVAEQQGGDLHVEHGHKLQEEASELVSSRITPKRCIDGEDTESK